jgi:hypothetical protein
MTNPFTNRTIATAYKNAQPCGPHAALTHLGEVSGGVFCLDVRLIVDDAVII